MQNESMDWFLYDRGLRHDRVKVKYYENILSFSKRFISFMFVREKLLDLRIPRFKARLIRSNYVEIVKRVIKM